MCTAVSLSRPHSQTGELAVSVWCKLSVWWSNIWQYDIPTSRLYDCRNYTSSYETINVLIPLPLSQFYGTISCNFDNIIVCDKTKGRYTSCGNVTTCCYCWSCLGALECKRDRFLGLGMAFQCTLAYFNHCVQWRAAMYPIVDQTGFLVPKMLLKFCWGHLQLVYKWGRQSL